MSNIKTKELIICLIAIIALVLTITTNVFATTPYLGDALGNNTNNEEIPQIPETTNNTNTNNNINTNNNTNTNTNTNKTAMPNTGVDYSVVFIIAVCGISAVYAYKKIRDYNV